VPPPTRPGGARRPRGPQAARAGQASRRPGGAPARGGLDATLAALADPARRRALDLLRTGPRRAGELAAAARRSGLIEEQRIEADARVRLFRLRPERLAELGEWLRDMQRFRDEQLDALQQHAERRAGEPGARRHGSTEGPGAAGDDIT